MNIDERLAKLFSKVSKRTDIKKEDLLKELGLDSLDLVELLMSIEEEFNIQFEEEEMLTFKTVQDVYDAIERKLTK